MAEVKWSTKFDEGIATVQLASWDAFDDYIREEMIDHPQFVWRGQADASWLLEPSLDRVLKARGVDPGSPLDIEMRESHLDRFKYASRGRRGSNPPKLEEENGWWALGQHNGLMTPLLDWTNSPYVAAYFALTTETDYAVEHCAVFGLSRTSTVGRSAKIARRWEKDKAPGRPPIIEFIQPLSDENSRLINQDGLFTRAPSGVDVEKWIRDQMGSSDSVRLVKLLIPGTDRHLALKSLNRMNINHSTLFPDLYGASEYVNVDLFIDNYSTRLENS